MEASLSGMYGDLQGLVGPSLPTVEGLGFIEAEESGENVPQLEHDIDTISADEVT
jgi:hypothetical protein